MVEGLVIKKSKTKVQVLFGTLEGGTRTGQSTRQQYRVLGLVTDSMPRRCKEAIIYRMALAPPYSL